MTAAHCTVKTWIGAPPERVFRTVGDLGSHGAWANPKAKLHVHKDGEDAFALDAMFLGKPVSGNLRVTKLDAPRRIDFDATHKEGTYRHSFVLRAERGGTLVERHTTFPDNGGLNTLFLRSFIVPLAFRPDARKTLKRLKKLSES